jgi:hypothetical protein
MRLNFFFILFLIYSFSGIYGQGSAPDYDSQGSELILMAGVSFYIGDLNQTGYLKYQDPAGGIGYRYNMNKRFAIRSQGLLGHVHASDAQSGDAVQEQRDLSFRSIIIEASAQVEFNFFNFKLGTDYFFSPYIFLGLGGFHFNPRAELNGTWYNLQPLSTEGEGTASDPGSKRYPINSVCVPFGFGFKWSLSKYIGIGIESGMRKTFTEYIDDVSGTYPNSADLPNSIAVALSNRSLNKSPGISDVGRQRGNGTTDWYNFTVIVISIKLPKGNVPCLGVQK